MSTPGTPLYDVRDLVHDYGDRPALRLRRLVVPRGAILGLAGPNGSGKSTLLRILAFIMAPSRGEILFDGRPATDPEALRRRVTLLLQDAHLLRRSVLGNVTYGLRLRGLPRPEIESRAHEALERVGLPPASFARRQWFELSGGERQRVALAARLALGPEALLLDEPTASLDPASADIVHEAAVDARRRLGTTLIVVSHDAAFLGRLADDVLNLATDCDI